MLDNFVGGAVSEGTTVLDSAVKEAKEEANVPLELALQLQPAGSVSFFHQSDRGIHPNTEFVFDLELPQQFQPLNNDGEVESWQLVPVGKILDVVCQPELFKITSSPVVIDWLIRRGNIIILPLIVRRTFVCWQESLTSTTSLTCPTLWNSFISHCRSSTSDSVLYHLVISNPFPSTLKISSTQK